MRKIQRSFFVKNLLYRSSCNLYIHEYQAYDLLKKYNVPLVPSFKASNPNEALEIAKKLMANTTKTKKFLDVVVKAQVHAGGRGKGFFKESGLKGGVQTAHSPSDVLDIAEKMIGNTLITPQTGKIGKKYRSSGSIAIVASPKGGMNIEQVQSNKVHKFFFPPSKAIPNQILNQIVKSYQLNEDCENEMSNIVKSLYQCFIQNDSTLIEINPLGIDIQGKLKICDSKINIDDNSSFRQKELFMMEDVSQKNQKEVEAEKYDLNYIALDGNIGCMVNGAGLAMATMDLIQMKGGSPANFLDVGGKATDEQVVAALRIMNSDPNVESILVNIFAGIARADIIALGLIKGINALGMKKPIVLRMKGTNITEAQEIISESGYNMVLTEDLEEAATKAVKMAQILKTAKQAKLNVSLL